MDIQFSAPQYIQTKDKKPAYHFVVSVKDSIIHSSQEQPTLSDILTSINGIDFLKNFASVFASTCSKYFPKPLVAEKLGPKFSHIINAIDDTHEGDGIVQWYFTPLSLCVSGTTMEIKWKLVKTTSVISWQEEDETEAEVVPETSHEEEVHAAAEPESKQDLQEVVSDDIIPATGDNKPEFILGPSAAAKDKDKKKLREAKLQVELARFRAARAYEKYIAKYGDDLSDTDTEGGESEYE
jgi:hypothetical protein